jgi:hypothetical protein
MSRVEIIITGEDKSDSAFRQARNNEERLKASAAEAGISLGIMGEKGEAAGAGVADGADRAREGVRRLDVGIGELDRGLEVLRDKFAETGNVDFLRQGKSLETARKELQRFKGDFEKLIPALVPDGPGLFSRMFSSVTGAMTGAVRGGLEKAADLAKQNPLIATAIAAGITIGAPAIGGALAATVAAGVLAGGIFAAAQNSKVKDAWKSLGHDAAGSFEQAAEPLVDPLIRGAGRLRPVLDEIASHARADFSALAPALDKLIDGAGGFVQKLMPGLDVFSRQHDALDAVADELPRIGAAFSDVFESISRAGSGSKEALVDVLHSAEGLLVVTGKLIEYTSRWYESEKALFHLFTGDMQGAMDRWILATDTSGKTAVGVSQASTAAWATVKDSVVGAGQAAELTAEQFGKLSGQISATHQDADVLAGAMVDKLLNTTMSLDEATLHFAESQTRLTEAVDKNGTQLDIHTAKGQANHQAILGVVAANIQQYDTLVKAGVSSQDAAAAYDQNTSALIKQMQAAGFTSAQIGDLIGKYMAVPDKVNTDIVMEGLTEAINGLDETLRLINNLPARRTVNVDIAYHDPGYRDDAGNLHRGPVGFRASGGVVGAASGGSREGRTMVGEHGFELLDLPPGTTVHSNEDSRRMLAAGDGGGSRGGGPAQLLVSAAPGLEQSMVAWLIDRLTFELRTNPVFASTIAAAS